MDAGDHTGRTGRERRELRGDQERTADAGDRRRAWCKTAASSAAPAIGGDVVQIAPSSRSAVAELEQEHAGEVDAGRRSVATWCRPRRARAAPRRSDISAAVAELDQEHAGEVDRGGDRRRRRSAATWCRQAEGSAVADSGAAVAELGSRRTLASSSACWSSSRMAERDQKHATEAREDLRPRARRRFAFGCGYEAAKVGSTPTKSAIVRWSRLHNFFRISACSKMRQKNQCTLGVCLVHSVSRLWPRGADGRSQRAR